MTTFLKLTNSGWTIVLDSFWIVGEYMWSSNNYSAFLASPTFEYQARCGDEPTICGGRYDLEKGSISCQNPHPAIWQFDHRFRSVVVRLSASENYTTIAKWRNFDLYVGLRWIWQDVIGKMIHNPDRRSPNHMTHPYCFFPCKPFALSPCGINNSLMDPPQC